MNVGKFLSIIVKSEMCLDVNHSTIKHYNSYTITKKELLRKGFDNGLYYQNGLYRTPLHDEYLLS